VLDVRSRYRPDYFTSKTLPALLDQLAVTQIISQAKGQPGRKPALGAYVNQTTIAAGTHLTDLITRQGVTLDDIGEDHQGQEVVLLKGLDDEDNGTSKLELVEYEDTEHTNTIRADVRQINEWLMTLDLSWFRYAGVDLSGLDIRDRHLRRHFTRSSFESGGRLFGGFWQGMKKESRKTAITIDGCFTTELDYSAMLPRLLYGNAGAMLPHELDADPYRIPGFERSRKGIKKLFNAMLFGENLEQWRAYPKETAEYFHPEERRTVQAVMEAIRTAHYPVKEYFGTGIGHALQNLESEILVAVLMRMKNKNLPGLPVHDAVIVKREDRSEVRDIMLSVFRTKTGIEGRVPLSE